MIDSYGRKITYLRISITDRCNLRCSYCMPEHGISLIPRNDILSYEEIAETAKIAVAFGIRHIRITGGEPLIRKDVDSLVCMLADIDLLEDLSMTTNGILLAEHADSLAKAGLKRVNISLDAINEDNFRKITRGGDVKNVLEGIDAAISAGLTPVKLNCVIKESSNEPDAIDVRNFAREKNLEVRFIREMDFASGQFQPIAEGAGGDCKCCTRLRLSANGIIRPCLFSNKGYSIKELGVEAAFEAAIKNKPEKGLPCSNSMHSIGG